MKHLVEVVITHKFVVEGNKSGIDIDQPEVVLPAIRDEVSKYYDIEKGKELGVKYDFRWLDMEVNLDDWVLNSENDEEE